MEPRLGRTCLTYTDGRRIDANEIIGIGVDGVVLQRNSSVLKVPKLYGTVRPDGSVIQDHDSSYLIKHAEHEKNIYEHLGNIPGVARYLSWSSNGLRLEYYENGSLEDYIAREPAPSEGTNYKWVCEIVDIVGRCHEKRVLVFDIALRNFVFAKDYSIHIIDFANSILVPIHTNMATTDKDGCTVKLDLLHLANVIYSIAKWEKFSVDCAMDYEWPDISRRPPLDGCLYAEPVLRCWNRCYSYVYELQQDLQLLSANINGSL